LGGLAGNNAHGAGFLQAALDRGVKPAMIFCTSGQIFWVSKFLEHMNQPERLEMDFDEKLAELKPLRLWCDSVAENTWRRPLDRLGKPAVAFRADHGKSANGRILRFNQSPGRAKEAFSSPTGQQALGNGSATCSRSG
jgi:hypothetical protein